VRGVANVPGRNAASGRWSINEVKYFVGKSEWPNFKTVIIETFGAEGGLRPDVGGTTGKGGQSKGSFVLKSGTNLTVVVGGKPADNNGTSVGPGGFNGGGTGGAGNASVRGAAGGGGASDVRLNGTGLANRIIVAGGAGGMANSIVGSGGGLVGTAGNNLVGDVVGGGGGGTQAAGGAGGASGGSAGSSGQGGNGVSGVYGSGGGGGGFFGGGSGGTNSGNGGASGGGGSGFVADFATDVVFGTGVRSGNGLVEITVDEVTTTFEFTGGNQTFTV
jgi:hypothetical protein